MDQDRTRELAGRLFESELRTLELYTIYIGERLGHKTGIRGSFGSAPGNTCAAANAHARHRRRVSSGLHHLLRIKALGYDLSATLATRR